MIARTLCRLRMFFGNYYGRPRWNSSSCFLFPGQGAQFVGMCQRLLEERTVLQLFEDAQEILGYHLLSICLHGPEEDLNKTVHCQPAIVVASLAALQHAKVTGAKVFERLLPKDLRVSSKSDERKTAQKLYLSRAVHSAGSYPGFGSTGQIGVF